MLAPSETIKSKVIPSEWYKSLAKYEKPHLGKAIGQLLNTFLPYIALWVLMVTMIQRGVSYWYLLPCIVVAAGLSVRIFIFFHDCGHGCFFDSHRANRLLGYICGILTFTPYEDWRHSHAAHHATSGDLDRRGIGDVWTMTISEYQAAPWYLRLGYRIFRNPFFLFVIGPPIMFFFFQRLPHRGKSTRERNSVWITNLAIVGIIYLASQTIGLSTYLLIQIPVMSLAAMVGVWLFYVQHQYEDASWEHHEEWDPIQAALHGSSYYKLPKVLQWFTGNIGLHHIHHLRPRIPNYHLQQCYDEVPELQVDAPLTFGISLKSLFLNLWDEKNQKMVSFWALKRRPRQVVAQNG